MQAGGTSYTYRPDGSLATKTEPGEAWEYVYDIQGRLTAVRRNSAVMGNYGYDQDGLRVWKEEAGRTTAYIRDGLEVLYEETFTDPVGPEAVPTGTKARVFLGGETAGLVVNGVEAHYYINDHLGTTELVTDELRKVSETITHTPFSDKTRVQAHAYLEKSLSETDWIDLANTTARIENDQAGPAKAPVEVNELIHQNNVPVLVEDPHYAPAKEFIYHHDDPDVVELKVVTSFRDPGTGGYVEYVDLLDLTGKELGDYKIQLETRKDVRQSEPTENLKFEVYISKRLEPVESVLQTKAISLDDVQTFNFTPQGTGLEDIVWAISRDAGETWTEVTAGTSLPADGTDEILLKADLKIVEGHEPPSVAGLDWAFTMERETSERYTFTGKERDATGLYYFGARYYDPEVGRFASEDPAWDGVNWYGYCNGNPIRMIDKNGLWGSDIHQQWTYEMAIKVGFRPEEATQISLGALQCDDIGRGKRGPAPVIGDLSYHFDMNADPNIDSRLINSENCLIRAMQFIRASHRREGLQEAGYGCHAIQDIFAHLQCSPTYHTVTEIPQSIEARELYNWVEDPYMENENTRTQGLSQRAQQARKETEKYLIRFYLWYMVRR